MNDYIETRFQVEPCDEIATDILAAILCENGYESFVPDETGLTAYIKRELFNSEILTDVLSSFPMDNKITLSHEIIEGQDWNSEWEKNYFQPIVVGDKCVIHSSFHNNIPLVDYDIVIDPKMAFGTGHHATTSLIIRQLLEMNLLDKDVIDMGTGTGILAILCAMCGAKNVSAIEIDEFAYVNAVENVKLNGVPQINVLHGDATLLKGENRVDVFIANINRNIITNDINAYADKLKREGVMLLSGFYEEDIPVIMEKANLLGLKHKSHYVQDKWSCLILEKIV
ncbi:MAG: 50S ribosomal protein L11 methyltransferase [Muribaculaceae bacterium]|nr:50S ribosomal protein L11 methyltransferase [Muribaculaceae bacterium]